MTDKSVFDGIMESLSEARDFVQGSEKNVRVTRVQKKNFKPVPVFSPEEIKEIRLKYGLSQPDFAALLGLSTDAIRSWEQGRVTVSGGNARFLELLRADQGQIVRGFELTS